MQLAVPWQGISQPLVANHVAVAVLLQTMGGGDVGLNVWDVKVGISTCPESVARTTTGRIIA